VLAQLQHGSRLSNGCFHESLFELGFAVPPAVSGVDFTVHQLSHDISRSGKMHQATLTCWRSSLLGRELSDASDAWRLTASLSNCAIDNYTSQKYIQDTGYRPSEACVIR
jgi:hypothetical protein